MSTNPDLVTLTLTEKIHEYGDVYSFIFKPERKIDFKPGMYAHVRIPNGEEGQKTREFSIASAPSEDNVRFTVHLREDSPYKRKLGELKIGDVVEVFKIKGDFLLPEDENAGAVFIAGGIGITPVRSMLIECEHSNRSVRPMLIHVAGGDYLFQEGLSKLPNEQIRITRDEVEYTLSKIVGDHPEKKYYVSGPPGFVQNTVAILKELKVPEENIVTDEFDGYEGVEE